MDVNFTMRFWHFSKNNIDFTTSFWRSERWSTERVARNFEKSQLYEGKTSKIVPAAMRNMGTSIWVCSRTIECQFRSFLVVGDTIPFIFTRG